VPPGGVIVTLIPLPSMCMCGMIDRSSPSCNVSIVPFTL